jgi:protein O-GlcNAc transferase
MNTKIKLLTYVSAVSMMVVITTVVFIFPAIKTAQLANLMPLAAQEIKLTQKEYRVISFGLYGDSLKYTKGALRNAQLAKHIYPGWVCRFYVDNTVPPAIIEQLRLEGAEIIEVNNPLMQGKIAGMFWRFMVADDPHVDRYLVRDTDSRFSMREAVAVEEWIASGERFHLMRDHPYHKSHMMLGGMWAGTRGSINESVTKLIEGWASKDSYLDDMKLLNKVLWPYIHDHYIAHDSFFCTEHGKRGKPFPTKRMRYEHVGQVFDENDIPHEAHMKFLHSVEVPAVCRGRPDWNLG